ncbi:fimbrial protein [Paraburkholderia solisilvae]|uniref:Major fimbrial subunit SMF-1 n=1 Tax=Paraburkholderia solisilvae TaxID=624376 RepID=A0A6J5E7F0_9BURK|nr:fimbrial protein [Paraburkholderia solisilvae]CAB3761035.1 Major fimbrial subunit SMF-1 [Paraburkholderia solisilvae]
MKSLLSTLALVSAGLVGVASINAHAADGTLDVRGAITDTTCSINGAETGSLANISANLPEVPAGSLTVAGDVAGTSNMGDIQMVLSGCSGLATKALARFENGPTVDQSNGYLKNVVLGDAAKNVEIRLLNDQLQPIDIRDGTNNQIAENGKPITSGSAILNYFAQYIATGKAEAGPVTSSVEYTMQYQ